MYIKWRFYAIIMKFTVNASISALIIKCMLGCTPNQLNRTGQNRFHVSIINIVSNMTVFASLHMAINQSIKFLLICFIDYRM